MNTTQSHKQTYYAHTNRQRRYLTKYRPRPSESSEPITQPLLHNRPTPTSMTRTCILSAGLTRQSQNLVAGPGKSMCRDGEWSEDKSLGACPEWKLRRGDWVRNRWHSTEYTLSVCLGECASRPLMIVRFDIMDHRLSKAWIIGLLPVA
jgi:hypothetical protein